MDNVMDLVNLFMNFLVSLAAAGADNSIRRLLSKSMDRKFQSCFEKALKKWNIQQTIDLHTYNIKDYHDLATYIGNTESGIPNEIRALIDIWIAECSNYPDCMSFIANLKQDTIIENQTSHTRILNGIDENQACIKKAVEAIDRKTDLLIANYKENSHPYTFQQKKDQDTLKALMEAFSFNLLDEFCHSDPSMIRIQVVGCYDAWTDIISRSAHHIYDPDLNRIITEFYAIWTYIIDTGVKFYFTAEGTPYFKFGNYHHDFGSTKEQDTAYQRLINLRLQMIPKLKEMADYIHQNYEIDLDECALKAFKS